MRRLMLSGLVVAAMVGAGCADLPNSPVSPTTTARQAVAENASAEPSLKATAPAVVRPMERVRVDELQPVLEWENAEGWYVDAQFTYDVELYEENVLIDTYAVQQGAGARTTFTVPVELDHDTLYRWRVRARFGNGYTPFTTTADFLTPLPPWTPGEPYGPERTISEYEALALIVEYHDRIGADLGSRSTRATRVDFLFEAVANIHYGHPVHNPEGGDRGWCVKDGGFGRPPSDDVIVRCDSRASWDLVSGAGADGYRFHLDYIGILPSDQNVYPPPLASLPK